MKYIDPDKILQDTRNSLDECGESRPNIADGADVSVHWLAKFAQGKISNPGIRKLAKLYNYLKK